MTSANDSSNSKTVKVKPFPIQAKMTLGTEVVNGQILKLTTTGFLFETRATTGKTGEKFQISFSLPVIHFAVNEACVIVKLYTTIENHVIEGHFQSLAGASERQIVHFLSRIRKTAG